MTYISTDYVFDGQGTEPWKPDCKDYKPLNVYGQTKLEGELAVSQTLEKYFIVRIAWVFGLNGKNFIKTMLNVGKLLVFLMVPLYTSVLSTSEYATSDLLTTTINLLYPFATLMISTAVMRFCLDKCNDTKQLLSIGIWIEAIGIFLVALLFFMVVLSCLDSVFNYVLGITILFIEREFIVNIIKSTLEKFLKRKV